MIRLAIDAKWYFFGPPSGRNVVRNIVDELIKNNRNFEIFLILNKKHYDHFQSFKNEVLTSKIKLILTDSPFNFITNLFCLNKLLIKNKIDIVLLQNFIPLFRSKKIIYVNYVHDFLFLDFPKFFTLFEKFIYRFIKLSTQKADHVITISKSEKNRILNHLKISHDRISFVYHGIDKSFKTLSSNNIRLVKNKFKLPEKYLLYVGRINVRKNLKIILEALPLLNNKCKLVIIGSSENDAGLSKKILDKFKNQVILMGHLNQDDLVNILSSSSIFIFPSFAEGFGLPPIEAMKSGVPVIVSDIDVHKEICSDAAIYFNPNSSLDLANKIDSIFNDYDLNMDYIRRGKDRSDYFNWESSIDQICEILTNLYAKKDNRKNNK